MARYPSNPCYIRFTQEEIDTYLDNSAKIVRNFVEREKIQDWVFDEYQMLHGDYEELTRRVWIEIFNCGEEIFEPLERLDIRFKLISDQDDG